MNRLSVWLLLSGLFLAINLLSQNDVINNAFTAGEQLEYDVNYSSALGDFNAGKAIVKTSRWKDDEGNTGFRYVGTGETNNFFDMFYKVRDRFVSKVDGQTLLPRLFIRNTREGSYIYDDTVWFNREKDYAYSSRKQKAIPDNVHDIVSAVYFMRTLSLNDFGADSIFQINFFLDDSVYHSHVLFEGRGIVETEWGWLPCLKVKPMLAVGEVFTNKYPMSVWITDDENHIPIMAESEIIVGSVTMKLSDFEGLKNPFIKPLTRKELKKFRE